MCFYLFDSLCVRLLCCFCVVVFVCAVCVEVGLVVFLFPCFVFLCFLGCLGFFVCVVYVFSWLFGVLFCFLFDCLFYGLSWRLLLVCFYGLFVF